MTQHFQVRHTAIGAFPFWYHLEAHRDLDSAVSRVRMTGTSKFEFAVPSSQAANAWLKAAAIYLNHSSPAKQRVWLDKWGHEVWRWPLTEGVTAFDKSLVIVTLEKWRGEIAQVQVAESEAA